MKRAGRLLVLCLSLCFFFQAEDGIRDYKVTGVQTCALPILVEWRASTAYSLTRILKGDSAHEEKPRQYRHPRIDFRRHRDGDPGPEDLPRPRDRKSVV